jgi:hypothetical protein
LAWENMIARCYKKSAVNCKWYGGRGVTVCDRWRKFENFLADMGEKPEGMTLDRKDSAGNYEPGNCRWLPSELQNVNRRATRIVDLDGRKQCLKAWCRELGLNYGRVYYAVVSGSDPLEVFKRELACRH